jgi:hypothetical protein
MAVWESIRHTSLVPEDSPMRRRNSFSARFGPLTILIQCTLGPCQLPVAWGCPARIKSATIQRSFSLYPSNQPAMSALFGVFDSIKDGELQTARAVVQNVLGSVCYPSTMVNLLTIFKGRESP